MLLEDTAPKSFVSLMAVMIAFPTSPEDGELLESSPMKKSTSAPEAKEARTFFWAVSVLSAKTVTSAVAPFLPAMNCAQSVLIDYEPIGSNLMPNVTIIERNVE